MKYIKKLIWFFLLIIVFALAIFVYGLFNADSLIKKSIEKYGSEALQANVSVSNVRLDLVGGTVRVEGLVIDNPVGFSKAKAFQVALLELDLDEKHLSDSQIVVSKVLIHEPKVTYEHTELGDNLSILEKNAIAYGAKIGESIPSSRTSQGLSKNNLRIKISNIYLNKGSVNLVDDRLININMTFDLPNIYIKEIKTGPDGSSVEEVASQVMSSLFSSTQSAAHAVSQESMPDLKKGIDRAGSQLKNIEKKGLNQVKKIFGN
jgi:hypothetical protein